MGLYDWLLFLHVIAAFGLAASLVVIVAVLWGPAASGVLLPLGQRLWDVSGIAVLVFGVWLALDVDGYELWDGWILAALVLYVVAAALGGRALREHRRTMPGGGAVAPRIARLYGVTIALTLVILVLMIYKPGA